MSYNFLRPLVLIGTTLLVAAGCSSKGGPLGAAKVVPPVIDGKKVVGLRVTPDNLTSISGQDIQIRAWAAYEDGTTVDVTNLVDWQSQDTGVGSFVSGSRGKIRTGSNGITELSAELAGLESRLDLWVSPATLVSIEVSPNRPSLPKGVVQQFTATGMYSDGSARDISDLVSWNSSNTSAATVGTGLGSKGRVVTSATGLATIKAALGAVNATSVVTVTNATLTTLQVQLPSVLLPVGVFEQMTATGTYSDNTTVDLTASAAWKSAATNVAAVTTGGARGRVDGEAAGVTAVTASVGAIRSSAYVQVTNATLQAISINPQNLNMNINNQRAFTATGLFSDGSSEDITKDVIWSSSNESVARVSNADNYKGQTLARSAGTAVIRADFMGTYAETTVTVSAASLSSVSISPAYSSVANGLSQQYVLTGMYSDGTTADVTNMATWASSSTAVATVSNTVGSKGLAVSASVGSTTISATVGSQTASASLTVSAATLSSLQISPASLSLAKGTAQMLTVTGLYSNGSTVDLTSSATWSSSNASVLAISNVNGSRGRVDALATGTSVVTAAYGGRQATLTITVTAATLSSLAITPPAGSVPRGVSLNFALTGTYSDGSTQDLTSGAAWSSSDNSIASVSSAGNSRGLATGVAQGLAAITATYGSLSASANLTVTAASLVSISVQAPSLTLPAGNSEQLSAIGVYSDGTTSDISSLVTWGSSGTSVATISNSTGTRGVLSAVSAGSTTVSAVYNGISGNAAITVTAASLVSIGVTPTNASIAKGNYQSYAATGVYSDNSTMDITSSVTWTSSSSSVATISNSAGNKGRAYGAGVGSATITATLGSVSGNTSLTVSAATLVAIDFNPTSVTMAKGSNVSVTATGTYSDNTTADITNSVSWSSSDAAVASVSNTAPTRGQITAVGVGTAVITGTMGSVQTQLTVTVTAASLSSLTVSPATNSIAVGVNSQYTVTGNYSDGTSVDLTNSASWSSSNTAVITIVSSGATRGLATAKAQGTATITANSNGLSATATVTVSAATLSSLDIQPSSLALPKGSTSNLTVVGVYSDNSTVDLTASATWASSNTAKVTVSNAAGSRGLVNAVAQGSANVTATYGGMTAQSTVTVSAATLASIALTPTSASLALGVTQQFTATGTYTDGTTLDITSSAAWSSDAAGIASVGNSTGNRGLVSAVSQGSANITASSGSVSAVAAVTVSAAALTSINISPLSVSIPKGVDQQMTASGVYSDGSVADLTETVTWTSSDNSVASISTVVGTRGKSRGLAVGSVTITATLGSHSGSTALTVTSATLSSIQINPGAPSVAVGLNQQFSAIGTYSDSSTADVSSVVTWTSSSTTVATISNSTGTKGLALAKAQGTSTITAAIGGVSGAVTLTVTAASLSSIEVSPTSLTLPVGLSQQAAATGIYSDSTTADLTSAVTWTSANSAVASVSNSAGTRGQITAEGIGSTTITASYGGYSANISVTVSASTLSSIAISASSGSVAKGNTLQLTATGTYSNGTTQNITSSVSWTSADNTLVSVSNSAGTKGLATGVAVGSAAVTATLGSVSISSTITVTNEVLVSIAVSPSAPSVAKGLTQQLVATGTYSDGSTSVITNSVTWSSSSASIASVSNSVGTKGLSSAVAVGTATISATLSSVTGTASVTVTTASLSSIAVTHTGTNLAKGLSRQMTATATYSDGSTADVTTSVVWSSSNTGAGIVSNAVGSKGVVTAVSTSNASTVITATSGAVSGTSTVNVIPAQLASISMNPSDVYVGLADYLQIVATAVYTDGTTADVTNSANWTVSNTAIVLVNNAGNKGRCLAVGLGSATVTATIGSVSGNTTFHGIL